MGHFREPGPAPGAGSRSARPRRPGRAGERAAGGGADRAARSRRPAARPRARSPPTSGVARNTVAEAYGQLVAEGWLTAGPGLGHPGRRPGRHRPAHRGSPAPCQAGPRGRARRQAPVIGSPGAASPATWPPGHPVPVLAASGVTGPVGLPAGGLAGRGSPRAERRPQRGLRLRPIRAGRPELRAGPGRLPGPGPRGARPDPDRIVVCDGFARGAGAADPGAARPRGATTLAVEAYGLPGVTGDTAVAAGLRLATLPVDGHGAAAGPSSARRGRRAAHSGAPVPARRARWLRAAARQSVEWAAGHRRPGHRGRLRRGVPLRPAAGRARCRRWRPSTWSTPGTASKSLAPGLRLGWLVLPAPPGRRGDRGPGAGRPGPAAAWTSSRWPSSSPPAAMTGTSAGPGWPTGGAGTGWLLRWAGRPRGSG